MTSKDRIGGYTLDQLLGAKPVGTVEKKQGIVSKIVGTPLRLIVGLVKFPFVLVARVVGGIVYAAGEVVKLPARLVGALVRPWKKRP